MKTFALVILIIPCIIWLSIRFWSVNQLEDHIITIGVIGFAYFLGFFGFNLGAGAALDTMHNLV